MRVDALDQAREAIQQAMNNKLKQLEDEQQARNKRAKTMRPVKCESAQPLAGAVKSEANWSATQAIALPLPVSESASVVFASSDCFYCSMPPLEPPSQADDRAQHEAASGLAELEALGLI